MLEKKYTVVQDNDSQDRTRVALLNLPGIGSKFFDPDAFKGYVRYLKENKVDKIILTGVLPKVPEFMGRKSAENLLRSLDKDIYSKHGKKIASKISDLTGDESIDGIKSLHYASLVAREYVTWLKEQTDADILYVWNENDFQNANWRIQNIKRRKKDLNKVKKEVSHLEKEEKKYSKQLEKLKKPFEKAYKDFNSLRGKKISLSRRNKKDDPKFAEVGSRLKQASEKLSYLKQEKEKFERKLVSIQEDLDIRRRMIASSAIDKYYNLGLIRDAREYWDLADLARKEYTLFLRTALGADIDFEIFNEEESFVEIVRTSNDYDEQTLLKEKNGEVIISPYGLVELNVDGETWLISQNFNQPNSSASITSNLSRDVKYLYEFSRKGKKVKYLIEFGPHVGPFKAIQYNLGGKSVKPAYVISLPKFVVDAPSYWIHEGIGKFLKTSETKKKYLMAFSGAVVVESGEKTAFEVLSHEYLRRFYRGLKPKVFKSLLISDLHIGAANRDPTKLTNFEITQTLLEYAKRTSHDYLLFLGDVFNGSHRPEISNREEGPSPKELAETFEYLSKKAVQGKLSADEFLQFRRFAEGREIKDYGVQLDEFKNRYGGFIEDLLQNKGYSIAFVSGNHTNKTVNFHIDESSLLKNMVPVKLLDKVYSVRGSESGAGYLQDEEIKMYLAHRPGWKGADLVSVMANHTREFPEYVDLFAAGDKHQASIGFVEEIPLILAPSAQQQNSYGDYLGRTALIRGGVDATIYRIPGEDYTARAMRVELLTEGEYLDKLYQKYVIPNLLKEAGF